MKKRLLPLLLALALTLGLTVPALAAQNGTDNFVRTRTYAGEFTDVTPDSTFYENAVALYEFGLSVGKSDGTFGLKDDVTVAQMLIFAGRIRSLYALGDAEAGAAAYTQAGMAAFEPYLMYLEAEGAYGLAAELNGLYTAPATRAQVAHVLAAALPAEALPAVNGDLVTQCYASRQFIPDVTEYTPYFQDILTLYKAGISVGSDAVGTFGPDRPVTRGAAAAMLTRMVDPALRLTPAWTVPVAGEQTGAVLSGATWGTLVPPADFIPDPDTPSEMLQSVTYMLSREQNTMTLSYGRPIGSGEVSQLMDMALTGVKTYCEQLYNSVTCTGNSATGVLTMTFSAVSAGSSLPAYRAYTLEAAQAAREQLWADGSITEDMTELEKAQVYYEWVCDHCTYDYSAGDESLSHIAWSLFHDGTAVCDGYTGAYNLLLRLEGIDCYALANADHIWTVATLDGTEYHIDTTWGDSGSRIDYTYFAMTERQSWSYHPW